jgi:hypothetical protein
MSDDEGLLSMVRIQDLPGEPEPIIPSDADSDGRTGAPSPRRARDDPDVAFDVLVQGNGLRGECAATVRGGTRPIWMAMSQSTPATENALAALSRAPRTAVTT